MLRATSDRLSKAWHDLVVGVIERGNASGVFRCDHPGEAAWMVVALSDAYALHSQSGSGLALDEMARGHMLADAVAIIGTMDIVFGEIDR